MLYIQFITGYIEQEELGTSLHLTSIHVDNTIRIAILWKQRISLWSDTLQWPNILDDFLSRKTLKKMKTQTQTQNKLAHSCMRVHMNDPTFVVGRERDNYCNSSVSECPWSSAQNISLSEFWFMFQRDNFLISLIRASPGTVLKAFFFPFNWRTW